MSRYRSNSGRFMLCLILPFVFKCEQKHEFITRDSQNNVTKPKKVTMLWLYQAIFALVLEIRRMYL